MSFSKNRTAALDFFPKIGKLTSVVFRDFYYKQKCGIILSYIYFDVNYNLKIFLTGMKSKIFAKTTLMIRNFYSSF